MRSFNDELIEIHPFQHHAGEQPQIGDAHLVGADAFAVHVEGAQDQGSTGGDWLGHCQELAAGDRNLDRHDRIRGLVVEQDEADPIGPPHGKDICHWRAQIKQIALVSMGHTGYAVPVR
jgi:hypothetical protein